MKVKCFIFIFLTIIYFFNLSIYINFVYEHLNRKPQIKNCSNFINREKEYPVSDKINGIENNKSISFYTKIKNKISNIDSASRVYFPLKFTLIEISHILDKINGRNIFPELKDDRKLIRFNNGYYGFLIDKKASYYEDGLKTVNFAKYLEQQNIKFAYIMCPSKFLNNNKDLPIGLKDYSNENVDSFLKPLYENDIKVLDFRNLLIKEYASHFDAFYKTDHHWKAETGFWATKKILNFLNENLNENFDESIINYKNFNFKIYPKLLFGSQGKKVSLSLAEPEDFTLITPKFDTQFSLEAYCRDIKREGPYEKAILELTKLHKNYYEISTLGTYLVSDYPVVRIKNNLTNNNKKILVIKDSFAVQVIPFLSCVIKEILLVERRTFTFHFNGSVKKLIEKEKPDIVLVLYYTGEFYPSNKNRLMMSDFE